MSKSILDNYLKRIQQDESIFPVDQFATKNTPIDSSPMAPVDNPKKRKHKIGNIYPEQAVSEQEMPHRKRCMVDFDGTIHKYSEGWKDGTPYDPPFPGTREAIELLKEMGFEIVIYTARLSEENAKMQGGSDDVIEEQTKLLEDWFEKYQIPYDRMTADKEPAAFYIDDKAVRIVDGNWDDVIRFIRKEMVNTGGK
jgi:hypothetical protein